MGKNESVTLFVFHIPGKTGENRENYVIAWIGEGKYQSFQPADISHNIKGVRKEILKDIERVIDERPTLESIRKIGEDIRIQLGLNDFLTKIKSRTVGEITILTNDVKIPWEWIYFEEDNQFLCELFPFGKTFIERMGEILPLSPLKSTKRKEEQIMESSIVILYDIGGNRDLPKLPYVQEEVTKLEIFFKNIGIRDIILIDGNNMNAESKFLKIIRNKNIKIIHYAGHIREDSLFMSSGEIECKEIIDATADKKMNAPLVFLNGCYSANIFDVWEQQKNLSTTFLIAGASGCICTLSNIKDKIASEFAQKFYEILLNTDDDAPTSIGSILKITRNNFKKNNSENSGWLLYTLHGSPSYELYQKFDTKEIATQPPSEESIKKMKKVSEFTI